MIKIPLALRDLKELLKDNSNLEEKQLHPIFFYEEGLEIFFYKVIGYVLYYVHLLKDQLPDDIDIDLLIRDEFKATQVPLPLHVIRYEIIG